MNGSIVSPASRSGSGTPLVLLHGLTGSWRIWAPVLDALSASHDVFAPTLPGHHGAPPPPAGAAVSIATLADGVERILDDAQIDTAHLCGNSLGGWLSLELARRGRARSVVALSPAGAWRSRIDVRRVATQISMAAKMGRHSHPAMDRALSRPRLRRAALRVTMEHGERVSPAVLQELLTDLNGCAVLDDILLAVLRDGPFAGDMSAVDVPLRIAWGEHDRTIPFKRYGAPYLKLIPSAELVMLPGVGHVPMYDDPGLVTRTILDTTGAADAATLEVAS